MKLHYSQTDGKLLVLEDLFETPMKLHYSQTADRMGAGYPQFETPMKLHYSQTALLAVSSLNSLRPL